MIYLVTINLEKSAAAINYCVPFFMFPTIVSPHPTVMKEMFSAHVCNATCNLIPKPLSHSCTMYYYNVVNPSY